MDASKIIVLILCLVTGALLVWVEMRSRRNAKLEEDANAKQQGEQLSEPELITPKSKKRHA